MRRFLVALLALHLPDATALSWAAISAEAFGSLPLRFEFQTEPGFHSWRATARYRSA